MTDCALRIEVQLAQQLNVQVDEVQVPVKQ
jgi:hypothetical protein